MGHMSRPPLERGLEAEAAMRTSIEMKKRVKLRTE